MQRYNGPANADDLAWDLAVDTNGDVCVVGTSTAVTVGSQSVPDFATIKYSSAGTPLWTNLYDGPISLDDDRAYAVAALLLPAQDRNPA